MVVGGLVGCLPKWVGWSMLVPCHTQSLGFLNLLAPSIVIFCSSPLSIDQFVGRPFAHPASLGTGEWRSSSPGAAFCSVPTGNATGRGGRDPVRGFSCQLRGLFASSEHRDVENASWGRQNHSEAISNQLVLACLGVFLSTQPLSQVSIRSNFPLTGQSQQCSTYPLVGFISDSAF